MVIDPAAASKVYGLEFEAEFRLSLRQNGRIRERMEALVAHAAHKRVLHIGCVDHIPLLAARIQQGNWLHGRLAAVASECVGFDTNADGIEHLRREYRLDNIYHSDVSRMLPLAFGGSWDLAIIGDVLEHVDNPVEFLSGLNSALAGRVEAALITVPNAFRAGNWLQSLLGREVINSDHRYWYTPFTLWKVLARAGLKLESLEFCRYGQYAKIPLKSALLRAFPALADTLLAVARFPDQ